MEALEPIIQDGGLLDIINSAHYDFKEEPLRSLQYITRIIFQRVSIDERARNIAKTLMMDEGVRFVEAVFDRAVEMGRLAPLDTHAMAVFINSVRIFTLHSWIIDDTPENVKRITEDEKTLYKYSAVFLTDLGSAGNRNNGAIRSSR